MRNTLALTCAALIAVSTGVQAQQSLFSQTPADPSAGFSAAPAAPAPTLAPAPAPTAPAVRAPAATRRAAPAPVAAPVATAPAAPVAAEEGAAPKPRVRSKPRGPQPARALTVVNASTATVTSVEITGGEKTVRWTKPIASEARVVVKLPPLKGCTVSVVPTFAEGPGNAGEVDICKDKTVRLTD